MPQVKPQRGARDPSYPPPGQFQAQAAYKSASSRPGRAKARTWVRTKPAEQSTSVNNPTSARIQVAQQSVGSFVSSLSKSIQVNQRGVASTPSQQASYVSSKRNTLTRLQPGFASKAVPKSGSTSQGVSQATRRLIHQGRHKLIQQPKHTSRPQAGFRSAPTALQQYRQFVGIQRRKRAATSVCAPAAKRANTWVRTGGSSAAVASNSAIASTSSSNSSAASYVRSTHSRKLQLVRQRPSNALTVPVTPVSRLQSRGTVLAKHLLSVRSLKRARRPALNVRQAGIAKPGKLQRIDGVLYKVGGSGLGRSLQRQITPKAVRPLLSPEGAYVRQGKHLTLRSMLTTPKAVIQRVSTARSRPSSSAASASISGRQKLAAAARVRRPSRLSKSSKPVQTHCLGLCTTEECPYAHVKVDPNAPVCQEFVSGHCPRGVSCTKKHLTPRMIRQLRQSKALQASRLLNGSAQTAGKKLVADPCTSQQSKATLAQARPPEAGQPMLQDEDLDLRPAFLR
ncbi:MAG: Zinc finger CCCH domain-containing 3 [Trebouxia sp. A1-2]|nr:MAG: Zinc finger CCCH domain-containing 3 [Trebouxia sp. A1-2]